MIRILTFILTAILLFNDSLGQSLELKSKLNKIFLQLPIDTSLTALINAANSDTTIKKNSNTLINNPEYFTGWITRNDQFNIPPESYRIEIFTSPGYAIGGLVMDSILIIMLNAQYGDRLTRKIKKQYISLITNFKNDFLKTQKFTIHADPGKIGEGYNFYLLKEDKIPYLTISLTYGDCTGKYYSIHICYNRIGKWD